MDTLASPSPSLVSFLGQHPYISLVIVFALIIVLTRFISAITASSVVAQNGGKSPPSVPYYFPLLGHIPNMAIDATSFLERLRKRYKNGVFTLNFFGSRHNILYHPGLATSFLHQKTANADNDSVGKRITMLVFGLPDEQFSKGNAVSEEVEKCYKLIQNEPHLSEVVGQTSRRLQMNVRNLVGSMSEPWEKVSNVKSLGDGKVEASLLPLIRDFCAWTATPTLVGADFLTKYPAFFDDIWALDRGFLLLAAGLPSWAPFPLLQKALKAKARNLEKMDTYHRELDKYFDGESTDGWNMDDVSDLVKARVEVYRKYNLTIRARAAIDHALLWAANANSNTLVFWMINRIYSDKELLASIRAETAPYIELESLKDGSLQISNIDLEGLCDNCPLLKSCYIETLRLDTSSWSFKAIKQDFVLQSRDKDAQPWLLRKGEFAHVAHDLHNTDPVYFENPMVFKPDRHIRKDGGADMGSIRPYGGGSSMCKGRNFASKESLLFPAAIIAVWDIEPAGGGPWIMPKHLKATGVYSTNDDTRVWIKKRKHF